jgi:hypothetical protein
MKCTVKSKAQLEPKPILIASTNKLAQTTLVIPRQIYIETYSPITRISLYYYNGFVPDSAEALELVFNEKIEEF